MSMNYIDLRSDTVTKPSPAMRAAMMNAEVGDDVFGEDPTVIKLQERIAHMLGKEAALFVPSGVMGNQICIKVHTKPGDEIILEEEAHIVVYETAASAFLSGVQLKTIKGRRGSLNVEQVQQAVRYDAYYMPKTALICLENTHGRSAGSVISLEGIKPISDLARRSGIGMHLDGARLWNACVASGLEPLDYAQYFDSLSVCFSKGLGAPVGSMIAGSSVFIEEALHYRKIFGGGMRQVGVLAAAALYALDNNIDRLRDDHEKASYFAREVSSIKSLGIDMQEVQTNMIFIETKGTGKTQQAVIDLLKSKGILVTPDRTSSIRVVMHLDVSMDEVKTAVSAFRSLFQ